MFFWSLVKQSNQNSIVCSEFKILSCHYWKKVQIIYTENLQTSNYMWRSMIDEVLNLDAFVLGQYSWPIVITAWVVLILKENISLIDFQVALLNYFASQKSFLCLKILHNFFWSPNVANDSLWKNVSCAFHKFWRDRCELRLSFVCVCVSIFFWIFQWVNRRSFQPQVLAKSWAPEAIKKKIIYLSSP